MRIFINHFPPYLVIKSESNRIVCVLGCLGPGDGVLPLPEPDDGALEVDGLAQL